MTTRTVGGLILAVLVTLSGCDGLTSAATHLARAQAGLQQGDYGRALEEAKKAVEKEPDNADVRLTLASAALKTGDVSAAEDEVAKAVEKGASPAKLEPVRIETLIALGRPQAATQALDDARTLDEPTRHLYKGRILLLERNGPAALAEFKAVPGDSPVSLDARLGSIDAMLFTNDIDGAMALGREIVGNTPDAGRAWMAIAGIEMRLAEYPTAAESLKKALENARRMSVPQRLQARAVRIEALIMAGQLDDAAASQQELEKMVPGSPAALLTGADVALARGDPKSAVEALQKVVQGMPGQIGPRAKLVEALLAQGSNEQALAEAGRLLNDFPNDETARLVLARAQLRVGQPGDAQATLQPLISTATPSPRALSLASQIQLRMGHTDEGLNFLEKGVELDPGNVQLKIQLAAAYLDGGRPRDAIRVLKEMPEGTASMQRDRMLVVATAATRDPSAARLEINRAIESNPQDVVLLDMAGAYVASTGDRAAARDYFNRALRLRADDASAILGLARLDIAENKLDEAARRVQDLLAKHPDHVGALGLMVEISARRGKPDEVERWLQQARQADPNAVQPRLALLRVALAKHDNSLVDSLVSELDQLKTGDQARVQLALGELFGAADRPDDAAKRFDNAVKLNESLPQPYFGLARLAMVRRDFKAARELLGKAESVQPGWMPGLEMLARLDAMEGNVAAGLRIASDLRKRYPTEPMPLVLQGDLMLASRRPADAVQAYEGAYAIRPSGATAIRIMGARRAAGQVDADKAVLDWLAKTPGDAQARRVLATYYLEVGRSDEAIAEYEQVIAGTPNDATALNNLAWLYSNKKDPRALETARKAYQILPTSPSVSDTYAWILAQSGETRKALEILQQVADKAKENIEIQYHYGYLLNAEGNAAKARLVLREALGHPGGGAARQQAEKLLGELGQ